MLIGLGCCYIIGERVVLSIEKKHQRGKKKLPDKKSHNISILPSVPLGNVLESIDNIFFSFLSLTEKSRGNIPSESPFSFSPISRGSLTRIGKGYPFTGRGYKILRSLGYFLRASPPMTVFRRSEMQAERKYNNARAIAAIRGS